MELICLLIVLAPLTGSIIAGLFNVSRVVAHWATILGVGTACLLSMYVFNHVALNGQAPFANGSYEHHLYTWLNSGSIRFELGFGLTP